MWLLSALKYKSHNNNPNRSRHKPILHFTTEAAFSKIQEAQDTEAVKAQDTSSVQCSIILPVEYSRVWLGKQGGGLYTPGIWAKPVV